MFVYLNDVQGGGGETKFPNIGREILPSRGAAVGWINHPDRYTEVPEEAHHAGLPPTIRIAKKRKSRFCTLKIIIRPCNIAAPTWVCDCIICCRDLATFAQFLHCENFQIASASTSDDECAAETEQSEERCCMTLTHRLLHRLALRQTP